MLYDGIDLAEGSDIRNLTVDAGNTFPSTPNTGEMFFRSDLSLLYVYNGTTWVETGLAESISGPTGPAGITGPTGPIGPTGPAGSGGGSSLPTLTGNNGKFLFTNGSTLTWRYVENPTPNSVSIVYDAEGQISTYTEMFGTDAKVSTYTYQNGAIQYVDTAYLGVTTRQTMTYDSSGRVTSIVYTTI